MARIKHAASSKRRKKRVLKATKGQFGHRKNRFRQAIKSLQRGRVYAFRDRKVRKRDFRRLWITRLNAACRESGLSYSRFISGLSAAKVTINRKMLADLAITSPETFKQLVTLAKTNNGAAAEAKTSKSSKS